MKQKLYFLLALFWCSITFGQTVTTLAGSTSGFADATGTAAKFSFPFGVAVDALGNVYVADTFNHKIRKISVAGVVSTLAGSGTAGFADGPGTTAQFNQPFGVAVDASGNVYVGDRLNYRVRKINSAGVVTTLAGNTWGFADGTGTAAQFKGPHGVAVDASGNVYVADFGNNRIRKITATGVVTTLAGSGTSGYADGPGATAQFNFPVDVAVDSSGNVYVADTSNHRIRIISAAGVVTTLAGSTAGFADGPVATAKFNTPFGVAVDGWSGNVYVADSNNHRIRKFTASGVVTTLAGSTSGFADGPSATAQFNFPGDVAVDASDNMYVVDISNHKIRKITPLPATHLNFDGGNDYVTLPNEANFDFTNSMTVELRVNSNVSPQQWDALISKGDNSWRLALNANGTVNFAANGTTFGGLNSTTSVTNGTWHHIAASYNGTTANLYINGVLEASSANTGNINNSAFQVAIGENLQMTGRHFSGNIDEVRIWNTARTAVQIASNAGICELVGNEAGLVAYYKFNQGFDAVNNTTITQLTDATANANHGTLTNFAKTGTTSNFLAGSPVTLAPIITGTTTVAVGSTTTLTGSGTANASNPWVSATPAVATVTNAGVVTGVTTGISVITYTNSNGCSVSATVIVEGPATHLHFDGTNDYVGVTTPTNIPAGNSHYTMEAWIKPSVIGSKGIVGWGNWGTTNQCNTFRLSNTGISDAVLKKCVKKFL